MSFTDLPKHSESTVASRPYNDEANTKKLAQASIALIGLNYSMDNGIDSTGVTTSRDMVSFPRIDW